MAHVYYVHIVPESYGTIVDVTECTRFDCDRIWDELNSIVEKELHTKVSCRLVSKPTYEYIVFDTKDKSTADALHDIFDKRPHQEYMLKSSIVKGK
jgi:hypothetical protein